MLFPMPGYRLWDSLMTATSITYFEETPWRVMLYFAHNLVIPITRLFDILLPGGDPMMVTALRETVFSAFNVALIYLFFRHYLKQNLPAIIIALAYIFCKSHWRFTTGGEEKDIMLVLNIIFMIGFFQLRGWFDSGIKNFSSPEQKPNINIVAFLKNHFPEIMLGIILAFAIMIHLENGLLILTIPVVYLFDRKFYGNIRKDLTEVFTIMFTAGSILFVWFSVLIFGINEISTLSGAVRWLLEYHYSGEYFDTKVTFIKQYVHAYSGFRRFIIGKYFEHNLLWLESIFITVGTLILAIRSYKYSPQITRLALIYLTFITIHFFFWLPWDPEQWNPVVFVGFLILAPGIFAKKNKLVNYSMLALVGCLAIINFTTHIQQAQKYSTIHDLNRSQNIDYQGGINSHFLKDIPYPNMVQFINTKIESNSIILVEKRHVANHFLMYTSHIPTVIKYLDKNENILKRKYYLSQLSLWFYKPKYSSDELKDILKFGNRNIYYLSSKSPDRTNILEKLNAKSEFIYSIGLRNFVLYQLRPSDLL
ncbi:MAG: hypothetical protein HQ509_04665 [Candidatus Marinimicrobia bacterium]|nr:hypothetical protein [Candidatus Neomarinimicrobiota bacterium]